LPAWRKIINAFLIKTWGRFLLWLVLGALYVFAGFVAFSNPLLTAVVLTLLLGAALVVSGIVRIVLAFSMKEGKPWGWALLSGVVTLLLGLIILARWPFSSLYVLGLYSWHRPRHRRGKLDGHRLGIETACMNALRRKNGPKSLRRGIK